MELSSVIAPLTQAFIKCWRGRLLHTFYTEGTADFLLEQLSRCCVVLASCEPYIHIYSFFEKGVLYTLTALHSLVSRVCVLPKTEDTEGKLTVAVTSTRQNEQWSISSRLKAQAIKPISAPFHIPDCNTNGKLKHCRKLQLKSWALLPIGSFFVVVFAGHFP